MAATVPAAQLAGSTSPFADAAGVAFAGEDIVTKGFILMLAGVPIHVGTRWWQKRTALTLRTEEEVAL